MPGAERTFVGFGFGAIQAGLFLYEAFRSGNFTRLVVAEVVPDLVAAVRRAGGSYRINIATASGIEVHEVKGVEILNPSVPGDARRLTEALAQASEICTALPSVDFYARGVPSVAGLIAGAIRAREADPNLPPGVIYTAENHNHAAEILHRLCGSSSAGSDAAVQHGEGLGKPLLSPVPNCAQALRAQFLNTVIGKMSGVVSDPAEIAAQSLATLVPDLGKAFLVEEFNRILISRIDLPSFRRGIEVFVEKPDLLPFEEAKLYGHNAVHALLGYLANAKGCRFMSEAAQDAALMRLAREAFLEESGAALIARRRGLDPLFTPAGYREYAEDLLLRMTNPWLRDQTARVIRDTPRKLGWNDRLVGTMRLALDAGIEPHRFALGAAAALKTLNPPGDVARLSALWPEPDEPAGRKQQLLSLVAQAQTELKTYGV